MPGAEVIHRTYSDFDELVESIQGWSLELTKLDAGPFSGELAQVVSEDFILMRGRFHSRLRQMGQPPPGFRTLALSPRPDLRMLWRHQPVSGDDMMVFPGGGELDCLTHDDFDVFTISFREDTLHAAAEAGSNPAAARHILEAGELIRFKARDLTRLRTDLVRGLDDLVGGRGDSETLKSRVLGGILGLAGDAHPAPEPPGLQSRHLALIREADEYIGRHLDRPVKVKTLASVLGVSLKKLEYVFRDHLGVGPKAYINSVRLNAVHRRLKAARPGSMRVADAANAYGFWHMGQFAADYRKLFGENPSATLVAST